MHLKVLLDIDGVLANWADTAIDMYLSKNPDDYFIGNNYYDIRTWFKGEEEFRDFVLDSVSN